MKYHYTEDQLPEIGKVVIGFFTDGQRSDSYEVFLSETGWRKRGGDELSPPYAWCEKPAPPPVKQSVKQSNLLIDIIT